MIGLALPRFALIIASQTKLTTRKLTENCTRPAVWGLHERPSTTIFDHFSSAPVAGVFLLPGCVNSRGLGREKAKYARNRGNCP